MNVFGMIMGLATLVVIGLGFVWVIQVERNLGYLWWPYFMAAGIFTIIGSLFIPNNWLSALVGITGASLVWGATELGSQAERVKMGLFPDKALKIRPPLAVIIARIKPPSL